MPVIALPPAIVTGRRDLLGLDRTRHLSGRGKSWAEFAAAEGCAARWSSAPRRDPLDLGEHDVRRRVVNQVALALEHGQPRASDLRRDGREWITVETTLSSSLAMTAVGTWISP